MNIKDYKKKLESVLASEDAKCVRCSNLIVNFISELLSDEDCLYLSTFTNSVEITVNSVNVCFLNYIGKSFRVKDILAKLINKDFIIHVSTIDDQNNLLYEDRYYLHATDLRFNYTYEDTSPQKLNLICSK